MTWQLGAHPDDAAIPAPGPASATAGSVPPAGTDATATLEPEAPEAWTRPIARTGQVAIRPRADTPQANALALLPLLPVLLSMGAPAFGGGWDATVVAAFAAPIALIQVALAGHDRRVLRDRGFVDLVSPLVALLPTPLYLGLRARRCAQHDPDARIAFRWAVAAAIVAVSMVLIGLGFQAAIGGLFEVASQE
ncbi:hypothetical protein [Schumannella sp. 10F1B-5-1]|uniref:hypothetical protein n=1 Tax=Schumannella sp. 10F1B-5-1 TaxID=2590780 RepID=UPI00113244E8|nr:hypothetical protein [Schumannella sp. 10F1B-5-1]TPW76859.1 hypothetical protein FJ658_02705 [Schumannella sp. 10F1B-5-1]